MILETLEDLVTETQRRLAVTASSTFFTPTKIGDAVKQAYIWASTIYVWPQLERAKKTAKFADQYYYDYPPKLQTDSITRLIVDGEKYEQKSFDDFLNYKHQTTGTRTRKIFADYGRQFFIYPTPTVSDTGDDKSIIVFGTEEVESLAQNSDRSIFSLSESAGNEAVVKKALSVLLPQAKKKKEGQVEEQEAINLLAGLFAKIQTRQHKYQRLNRPMFSVPDFFSRSGSRQNTGNFDVEI